MKKIGLLLFFILAFINVSLTQTSKYRSYAYAEATRISDQLWTEWTEWKDSDVLILVNHNEKSCTVYASKTNKLDLVKYIGTSTNNGVETSSWIFVDDNGIECRFELLKDKDIRQIYIIYPNFKIVYECKIL
jgi:hypothetical protein